MLQGFGLGEAEWKALHGVEWSKVGDRTYLFPSDALKLVRRSGPGLSERGAAAPSSAAGRRPPTTSPRRARISRCSSPPPIPTAPAMPSRCRRRASAPCCSARISSRAPAINTALRLLYQFKIWPADMIMRAWGREIYGTIGDGRMDQRRGPGRSAVGAIVFGVASEAVRDAIQGKDPIAEIASNPLRGDRSKARSAPASARWSAISCSASSTATVSRRWASSPARPFAQIDTLMDLLHAGGQTKEGTFSASRDARARRRPDEAHARQHAIHEPMGDVAGR